MGRHDFAVATYAEHPELRNVLVQVNSEPWPEFMHHHADTGVYVEPNVWMVHELR